MRYTEKTPRELAQKTIQDIQRKRQREKEGQKQALMHVGENQRKIQKRLSHIRN